VADTASGAIAIASASGSTALVLDTKKAADDASFTVHGAGVSGGIAIGHAHLISSAQLEVAHYEIATADIPSELQRFDLALNQVRQELEALKASVPVSAPAEMVAFLGLHQMILEDHQLTGAARLVIQNRRCNAEWALVQQMDSLVAQFDAIEDAYLRERRQDIMQVAERVLKAMMTGRNTPPAPTHEEDIIVVAHDLSPADMILFKKHQFAGFVTDLGGVTSHTAIVARSLGIPAIVGLHHARNLIREGELLIVDGREGVLLRCYRNIACVHVNWISNVKNSNDCEPLPLPPWTASRSNYWPISSCRVMWKRPHRWAPTVSVCFAANFYS
jgi:phosphotransferase system enzyme I (PtsI)